MYEYIKEIKIRDIFACDIELEDTDKDEVPAEIFHNADNIIDNKENDENEVPAEILHNADIIDNTENISQEMLVDNEIVNFSGNTSEMDEVLTSLCTVFHAPDAASSLTVDVGMRATEMETENELPKSDVLTLILAELIELNKTVQTLQQSHNAIKTTLTKLTNDTQGIKNLLTKRKKQAQVHFDVALNDSDTNLPHATTIENTSDQITENDVTDDIAELDTEVNHIPARNTTETDNSCIITNSDKVDNQNNDRSYDLTTIDISQIRDKNIGSSTPTQKAKPQRKKSACVAFIKAELGKRYSEQELATSSFKGGV